MFDLKVGARECGPLLCCRVSSSVSWRCHTEMRGSVKKAGVDGCSHMTEGRPGAQTAEGKDCGSRTQPQGRWKKKLADLRTKRKRRGVLFGWLVFASNEKRRVKWERRVRVGKILGSERDSLQSANYVDFILAWSVAHHLGSYREILCPPGGNPWEFTIRVWGLGQTELGKSGLDLGKETTDSLPSIVTVSCTACPRLWRERKLQGGSAV